MKRFEALRVFTLESGQHEIERQNQQRKGSSSGDNITSPTLSHTGDEIRGPAGGRRHLSHVPEEGAFAIGDESDEEGETQNTPSQSSPSVSSSVDDSVPLQLRGMSEKARGKMPASQMSFSRQNSATSLSGHTATLPATSNGFVPTAAWVRNFRGRADLSIY